MSTSNASSSLNPARVRSDLSRLGRESAMLEATVVSLSAEEFAQPSLCAGWSRAHVVAHLAANAQALTSLVEGAVSGQAGPMYPSREARDAQIEELAGLGREELIERLRRGTADFAEAAQRLTGELALAEVEVGGHPVPATSLVAVRIAEVVVHHHDLDTAWTIEEADPDSLLNAVESAVRAMRNRQAPGLTLVSEEGEEWVIGGGGVQVHSDREGLLAWLSRGDSGDVRADGPLPELPAW